MADRSRQLGIPDSPPEEAEGLSSRTVLDRLRSSLAARYLVALSSLTTASAVAGCVGADYASAEESPETVDHPLSPSNIIMWNYATGKEDGMGRLLLKLKSLDETDLALLHFYHVGSDAPLDWVVENSGPDGVTTITVRGVTGEVEGEYGGPGDGSFRFPDVADLD